MKSRSRAYGSQKTCHQCRKRTVGSVATCKKTNDDNQCSFLYCQKCLFNRYGEDAEEKTTLSDWICPKCRGICNCSFCMRKRGNQPTGVLVHEAKANGFSSVAEMLNLKKDKTSTSENMSRDRDITRAPSNKRKASEKYSCEAEKNLEAEGVETRSSKSKRLRNKNGGNSASGGKPVTRSSVRKTNPKKCQLSKDGGWQVRRNADLRIKDKEAKAQKHAIKNASARCKGIDLTVQKSRSKKSKTIGKVHQPSRENFEATVRKKASRELTKIEGRQTKTADKGSAETQQAKKRCTQGAKSKKPVPKPPLPQGIELRSIDAIEIPAEDVGNALQFLEFCEAFGEVLNLKKGQSEQLLRELACERNKCPVHYSVSQLHIQLLSLIWKNCGKEHHLLNRSLVGNSWFVALAKYISGSQHYLKHLQLGTIDVSGSGYDQLDSSAKLRIVNFLCDEALGTAYFRSLITAENIKLLEREKKAKGKVLAESGKARNMKKLQDDVKTKAIPSKTDVPCSTSENGDISSEIKLGVTQLGDNQEASETVHDDLTKEECRPNIIRCEPTFLDGRLRFWKLSSYFSKMDILLQEIEKGDSVESTERWYSYDVDERAMVEKYIASFRVSSD